MEPSEGASPGAPNLTTRLPHLLWIWLSIHSRHVLRLLGGVDQYHLCAAERNEIINAGVSSLISIQCVATETSKVQLVPHCEVKLKDTDKDNSLYDSPKLFSTLSQHTVDTASSDTEHTIDNLVTVSTISSTDSCTEIEYACKALEQPSFSDTAVAGVFVEWGKDDTFIEEEVEAAMDVSTSLKRKEKEGDEAEETGFESYDSRDVCAQDERRTFQMVKGEDAFTHVIKRKTKKRNKELD
ncbi:hypothetical protein NDU88_010255 [Pleurodeles waltl]|uniref:Uncharacterized protein n=1 Tax=Pleurodeles waltl TaxID=8319 RepID=A0AAV7QZR9_PLEWA|nr:hypothetical protein NDU88_010255 [Pleurodeles waltl]